MKPLTKALGIGAILMVVFCVSFFFFYKRAKKTNPPTSLFVESKVINQRLPKTHLVSISGQPLDDEKLRHGKVILAIMMPDCGPCDQENDFLKTIVDSRKDVRFFYVIPFGNKNVVLKLAQSKYALEPVYDNGSNVAKTLEINQVPIKLFLEDGIIRRTWVDATVTPEKQTEFKNWLRDL
jgi:thiol-disulfide isomerase/thioredoxin